MSCERSVALLPFIFCWRHLLHARCPPLPTTRRVVPVGYTEPKRGDLRGRASGLAAREQREGVRPGAVRAGAVRLLPASEVRWSVPRRRQRSPQCRTPHLPEQRMQHLTDRSACELRAPLGSTWLGHPCTSTSSTGGVCECPQPVEQHGVRRRMSCCALSGLLYLSSLRRDCRGPYSQPGVQLFVYYIQLRPRAFSPNLLSPPLPCRVQ